MLTCGRAHNCHNSTWGGALLAGQPAGALLSPGFTTWYSRGGQVGPRSRSKRPGVKDDAFMVSAARGMASQIMPSWSQLSRVSRVDAEGNKSKASTFPAVTSTTHRRR